MRQRWVGAGLALVATLVLALAACGGSSSDGADEPATDPPPPTETEAAAETDAGGEAQPGGVYRVGVETGFGFTNGFDPTGEYLVDASRIQSNLLLRTLLGPRHVAGPPGNELYPDLAADLPVVSDDGLTYTLTLKNGIKFAPPIDREITSQDVLYAFERIGTESLVAQYGFYYDVIDGMQEFKSGDASSIAGIETPDSKTIVFHLTEPTGDFAYRLALPATAPIPKEVAGCFDEAGQYGRYVIASGPYMIEGSDELDITSCDTIEPISGYDPNASLTLVRNPSYDPATDTPEARENLPDRFEFTINSNADDIFEKIKLGELDGEIASTPPAVIREYIQSDELKDRLKINPADAIFYLSLNLTQPPFDDLHVRRAVNFVIDRGGLQKANGGPTGGEIATHVLPDSILNEQLADYDPYPSDGHAGDVDAARAEMKQSRYDKDQNGICDAPECKDVLHVTSTLATNRRMAPVIEASLAEIGITLKTRELDDAFPLVQTVAKNIPLSSVGGFGKDYPDASTFMVLFDSRSIIPTGSANWSLVGLTPEQASTLKGLEGQTSGIPSVDADIAACKAIAGDERLQCWMALDRKLTEEIVPWIPYLDFFDRDTIGPAVAQWGYDQFFAGTAYAHVGVDPAAQ